MIGLLGNDEKRLRRLLLFRLLKGFDFENPVFQYERIAELLPSGLIDQNDDAFLFKDKA
ncbi:hypothetical protein OAN307_c15690 [Octadecabacter antarcticus 307]|uniref:Uncharacterized protein n=1 Tax=Octadecabacter antarcticus 307 TaxID=391626 RepID=M9R4U9_9RHOB|nr:hypothetical protein [Octadecabacter antarcticus]AGI67242.1 hypothetical protein OAN307_c15690 [Octadecabacter antarcticus 307]